MRTDLDRTRHDLDRARRDLETAKAATAIANAKADASKAESKATLETIDQFFARVSTVANLQAQLSQMENQLKTANDLVSQHEHGNATLQRLHAKAQSNSAQRIEELNVEVVGRDAKIADLGARVEVLSNEIGVVRSENSANGLALVLTHRIQEMEESLKAISAHQAAILEHVRSRASDTKPNLRAQLSAFLQAAGLNES